MHPRPLIVWIRGTPLRRALTALAGLLAVLAVGLLDYVTGAGISFAGFYVLVIVAVTVVGGAAAGVLAGVASAGVWGVAEALTGRFDPSLPTQIGNGIVRCIVHVTVVFLVSALLRARDAARESEARSRAFLASAAHQLRTPVAALGTSVEALLLEGASPAQERLLANVATEAARLGRLVGSLLRTARLDQGEPLQPEPTGLAQLCEDELDRVRQLSSLEWRLTVEAGTPPFVVVDPRATSEALGNLLDNARRHAATAVAVRVGADRGHVVIEVRDDGPGLPSGLEAKAFDRFVTLDGRGGTGLGLAIARDLVRRQGGDLTYDHKAFLITLPRVEAGSAPTNHRGKVPDGGPPASPVPGSAGRRT
ncbi:MAG: HAMP domain-containing sensor histidine kinase [Actinomycetota bacterium]|jgi:two-component system, OmpR family, sensor kinase